MLGEKSGTRASRADRGAALLMMPCHLAKSMRHSAGSPRHYAAHHLLQNGSGYSPQQLENARRHQEFGDFSRPSKSSARKPALAGIKMTFLAAQKPPPMGRNALAPLRCQSQTFEVFPTQLTPFLSSAPSHPAPSPHSVSAPLTCYGVVRMRFS